MLELVKRKLEIKIYGNVYSLNYPTVGLYKKYEALFKDSEKAHDSMVDFLSKLGLPAEISEDLEVGHFSDIISALVSSEKKN